MLSIDCRTSHDQLIVQISKLQVSHKNDNWSWERNDKGCRQDTIINCKRTVKLYHSPFLTKIFCFKMSPNWLKMLWCCGFFCWYFVWRQKKSWSWKQAVFTLTYKLISFYFKCLATNGTFCLQNPFTTSNSIESYNWLHSLEMNF